MDEENNFITLENVNQMKDFQKKIGCKKVKIIKKEEIRIDERNVLSFECVDNVLSIVVSEQGVLDDVCLIKHEIKVRL